MHSTARLLSRSASLGFIGLGSSGRLLAHNLLAGSALESSKHANGSFIVCEPNDANFGLFMHELKEPLREKVKRVGSGAEMAPLASVIHTRLPNSSSKIVQSVYLQPPSSLLVGLKDTTFPPSENLPQGMDTLLVDHTTYDIDVAQSVAKQVGSWTGGRTGVVDAVFLEGKGAIPSGKINFLVGGTKRDFDAAVPFLNYIGSSATHCGPSGAGLSVQIVNNSILALNQIALSEGMLLGSRLSLCPTLLASILNRSSAQSWSSAHNNPDPTVSLSHQPGSNGYTPIGRHTTSGLLADLKLALNVGTSRGSPMPLGYSAAMLYENVVEEGDLPEAKVKDKGQKDFSVVYEWLRERAEGGIESWGPSEAESSK
ncbi:Predicted dehydrogenase [Phaffia rhodozyma]|uniref:3-hydroxyisobutyrate dehydrogenase n=1 Tax=Phaffia rhodozyma TaxID=264483 RepID=A0A0F7SNR0_PHARH|nr:Predicted dehydrogenase [Phaffia rhodozyma]